jgi:hypothetical protein
VNYANYKQIYAVKKANEQRILKVCPNCPNTSGIYFLLREENGFKFGYIGKAKHLLERLGSHLAGRTQWIDRSLYKHGLYAEENPTGYRVNFLKFPENELDEKEQYYIKKYANAGYQMKNSTTGSQGKGKKGLDNAKPPKNYYDGLSQGYRNAQKFVANLFEKHLDYKQKSDKPNKNQEKAMQKFRDFIEVNNNVD